MAEKFWYIASFVLTIFFHFFSNYLTLPIDVLDRTSGNNFSPDIAIFHTWFDFFSACAYSAFFLSIYKCLWLTTFAFRAVCWPPEHQFGYILIFLSDWVARELESSLSDGARDWWYCFVQLQVSKVLLPADVETFSQHSCVASVQWFIYFFFNVHVSPL